ncbi:MAG: 5-(carboxyamino)imidazole ribonucleotide mutase [bacterium]|nr:5-(carboxyamino)imidazole ribonucleotide mutase [bacterium]
MNKPLISIVMGSDSDLPVMREALEILDEFDIPFAVRILSAHRTPKHTIKFAEKITGQGVKVVIAAAGGAAHLPGIIAAHTPLPVIGVPIQTKALSGVDSLYSIVQMPSGVPVATVGINAARNSALLAIQILALSDKDCSKKLQIYKIKLERDVLKKDKKLAKVGWRKYDIG